jgi:hypothetical protein
VDAHSVQEPSYTALFLKPAISAPKAKTAAVIPDPQENIKSLFLGFFSLNISFKSFADFNLPSTIISALGKLMEFGI